MNRIDLGLGLPFLIGALLGWLIIHLTVRWFRRRRLMNPDYCFPSLGPLDPPHEFEQAKNLPICKYCGAGKRHQIHTGGPWPPPRSGSRQTASKTQETHSPDKGSEF